MWSWRQIKRYCLNGVDSFFFIHLDLVEIKTVHVMKTGLVHCVLAPFTNRWRRKKKSKCKAIERECKRKHWAYRVINSFYLSLSLCLFHKLHVKWWIVSKKEKQMNQGSIAWPIHLLVEISIHLQSRQFSLRSPLFYLLFVFHLLFHQLKCIQFAWWNIEGRKKKAKFFSSNF